MKFGLEMSVFMTAILIIGLGMLPGDAKAAGPGETVDWKNAVDGGPRDNGRIIVSGHTSVIYLSSPWWKELLSLGDTRVVCLDFTLQASGGTVPKVEVTSTGLGRVGLWEVGPTDNHFCSEAQSTPDLLVIEDLNLRHDIRLRIGPLNLASGNNLTGVLVVYDGVARQELPLSIMIQNPASWITATRWVVGVLISLVLAGIVAMVGRPWTEALLHRRRQSAQFRRFKIDNRAALITLFTNFYPVVLVRNPELFSSELRDDMATRGILGALPDREAVRMEELFKDNDKEEIIRMLAQLFPQWKKTIRR